MPFRRRKRVSSNSSNCHSSDVRNMVLPQCAVPASATLVI